MRLHLGRFVSPQPSRLLPNFPSLLVFNPIRVPRSNASLNARVSRLHPPASRQSFLRPRSCRRTCLSSTSIFLDRCVGLMPTNSSNFSMTVGRPSTHASWRSSPRSRIQTPDVSPSSSSPVGSSADCANTSISDCRSWIRLAIGLSSTARCPMPKASPLAWLTKNSFGSRAPTDSHPIREPGNSRPPAHEADKGYLYG